MTPGSQQPFLKIFAQALKGTVSQKLMWIFVPLIKGYILRFSKTSRAKFVLTSQGLTPRGVGFFKLTFRRNLSQNRIHFNQGSRWVRLMKKTGGRKSCWTVPLIARLKRAWWGHANSIDAPACLTCLYGERLAWTPGVCTPRRSFLRRQKNLGKIIRVVLGNLSYNLF